ncbi:MAG: O-methyltransferase [Bacteroidota bacterium]
MEFLSHPIFSYVDQISSPEPELLRRLHRETHLKVLYPRMISGHLQGRFLSLLTHLIRPRRVLEIGTFTGYAAICIGEGLPQNGELHTLEMNAELDFIIQPFLKEAGLSDRVTVHYGKAKDTLQKLNGPFDMVFIDADKANYLDYYHMVFDWLPSGGLILADNVLWDGKVIDDHAQDKETKGIKAFNDFVRKDDRVEKVLLPLRDGLFLIRKK